MGLGIPKGVVPKPGLFKSSELRGTDRHREMTANR